MLYFIIPVHLITSTGKQYRDYQFGAVLKEGGRDLSRSSASSAHLPVRLAASAAVPSEPPLA